MKLNLKMLAVSTALLGLLAAGAALPASAAGPLNAAAALSLPWSAATVESVETGTYASTMTVGTQQQLSPVILPAKAARKATVTFMSNDSTIVNVTSEGVAQAVGVGTAQVIASADGVSCVYTITTELDESMIVKEMDITLASSTIAVGETTSLSLGVLPSSASNYASVSLSSSDPAVATVNNFGKVTGVAPGTATITAASGGLTAQCIVRCRWTESAPDGSAGGSTSAAKSVDLAGFYSTIAGKYDMSRLEPVDATVQETFYPELMQVNTDQRLVYMCAMSPAPIGDLVLVEVADAKDVDTVKNLLQARISYMVGDGTRPGGAWYPEPTDMWENESRVVSNGNYVMLVVCEDCDSIVSDFNALF